MTDDERQAASLEHMRRSMFGENEFEIAVFIGGMEGIFKEFDLFGDLCPSGRRLPILSTGGATLHLAERLSPRERDIDLERLKRDIDYVPLLFDLCGIDPSEPRSIDR